MLPDEVLSTVSLPAQFIFPRNIPRRHLIDYEYGGAGINDPQGSLRLKVWKGEYIENEVVLSATGVAPVSVLAIEGLSDFSFTFDRNMRLAVAYEFEDGSTPRFRWFDTIANDYVTLVLPSGSITPRCAHDDNRDNQSGISDIILAYCRAGSLYFRAQRERYAEEHLLSAEAGESGLIQIGMNSGWRLQFQLSTASTT
jgi:hypothetical protein